MLRYTIYRARPGLVAFYDIWRGNGAGLFLQPGTHTGLTYEKSKNKLRCMYRIITTSHVRQHFKRFGEQATDKITKKNYNVVSIVNNVTNDD